MLRDLSTVLEDLHHGLQAAAGRAGHGVRIAQAEMTLPMDFALVLQGGGCVLRADVARNAADTDWTPSRSRLVVNWAEMPTDVFACADRSAGPLPSKARPLSEGGPAYSPDGVPT